MLEMNTRNECARDEKCLYKMTYMIAHPFCCGHSPLLRVTLRSFKAALVAEHNDVRMNGMAVTAVDHVLYMRRTTIEQLLELPSQRADIPESLKEVHRNFARERSNSANSAMGASIMCKRTWQNRIRLAILPQPVFAKFLEVVRLNRAGELKGSKGGGKPLQITGLENVAADRHVLIAFLDALIAKKVALREHKSFQKKWKRRSGNTPTSLAFFPIMMT